MPERAFETPEEAAIAEWQDNPQAEAKVVSVEFIGADHAVVITDTVPSHPMWNNCERTDRGWVYAGDHN